MKSTTPFSCRAYLITDCNYPIALSDIVFGLISLEVVFCIVFCDGLRTSKCSVWRYPNRVLRVERGESARLAPVECLVKLHLQRTNLLFHLWIDRLLGEG